MGGGKRAKRQQQAQNVSQQTSEEERAKAAQLQTELNTRKGIVGEGLPETLGATRAGATNLRDTGGLDPATINPIRSGYSDMAMTGGFTPAEKTNFLRRASSGVSAVYGRAKDELTRRGILGGTNSGFDASKARLTRQQATAGSEANLNANVDLASQVRSGKVAGLGGLTNLAGMEQSGKIAGQDALQRYSQFGTSALNEVDTTELRNRLQSGQMSQADAELLKQLAAQDKTLFDKIMQGVSVAAGAVSGVAGAMK